MSLDKKFINISINHLTNIQLSLQFTSNLISNTIIKYLCIILSGVGVIVGAATNKVLDYNIMNKDCRKCKTTNVKKHKCQRNHAGSSKSMEAAAAVTMFKRSEQKGLRYTTLIGDDDSTTLYHVRKNLQYQITKWSDIQHTKRSLYGQLLNLKKKTQPVY